MNEFKMNEKEGNDRRKNSFGQGQKSTRATGGHWLNECASVSGKQ